MTEQELVELCRAVRAARQPGGPLTGAEREALLAEHLGALLRWHGASAGPQLPAAARERARERLVEAVRSPAGGGFEAELAARRNGRQPVGADPARPAPRPAGRPWGRRAGILVGLAAAAAAAAFVWVRGHPGFAPGPGGAGSPVTIVRAPAGAQVPEGVLDPAGDLLLVYGRDGDGYYARGQSGRGKFGTPVLLNRRRGTVILGGEHGPRVARGRDGAIHVVWLAQDGRRAGVWYTRSTDGGNSFEPERNVLDTVTSCNSPAVTADRDGHVWVFWLDNRLPADPATPMSAPIYMARSSDDGRTFTHNEQVRHDHPGPACVCCRLEARLSADGDLFLSFRSAYRNVRDAYLLKGRKDENRFHAVRISEDDWHIAECPGSGIPFSLDEQGRVLASWMSRGRVYWARSDDGPSRFGPRIAAPDSGQPEDLPLVVNNARGDVLLLWKERERLRWACYDRAGRFTGRAGVASQRAGKDKPTAFVGGDGRFNILM